mmetsp:Transcript_48091/g.56206  ORF Transcript_48091/g.56206 Transcript_48091/m.56206 type:complete len:80 (+) Transcript_48091:267-506(+)
MERGIPALLYGQQRLPFHSHFIHFNLVTAKQQRATEREEIFACKQNVTSSAYRHCSIYPFDIECDGWKIVLDALGKLNK